MPCHRSKVAAWRIKRRIGGLPRRGEPDIGRGGTAVQIQDIQTGITLTLHGLADPGDGCLKSNGLSQRISRHKCHDMLNTGDGVKAFYIQSSF